MLRDEMLKVYNAWAHEENIAGIDCDSEKLIDHIIAHLDKRFSDEGWTMKDWDHMHRTWYERGPTIQEVLKGRAVKQGWSPPKNRRVKK